MDMDMALEMIIALDEIRQDIPMEIGTRCQMDMTRDPYMAQIQMSYSAMDESTDTLDTLAYVVNEGASLIVYISLDGGDTWQKQIDPQNAAVPQAPLETVDGFLGANAMEFAFAGTQEVDGKSASVFTGRMDGQRLQEILSSTGAMEGLSEAMGGDLPDDALLALGDVLVTILIDEESGLPVRIVIDMTESIATLMNVLLVQTLGGYGIEVSVENPTMVLTIALSRFDSIEPIEIPEAVLNAPEM